MRKNLPAKAPNTIKSYVDAVIRFVNHRDIVLTPDQELYMQRLQFADQQVRSRKYTRQTIINQIVARFPGTSTWRADSDITDAHKVFGSTRKINKAYLLTFHLDDIQEQIQTAKLARRLELLPRLNDNYTNALNSLPAEEKELDSAPAKIIFIIKGAADEKPLTVDAIMAEAEKLLKEEISHEYLDFEE